MRSLLPPYVRVALSFVKPPLRLGILSHNLFAYRLSPVPLVVTRGGAEDGTSGLRRNVRPVHARVGWRQAREHRLRAASMTPRVREMAGIFLYDVDVFEINEAFPPLVFA